MVYNMVWSVENAMGDIKKGDELVAIDRDGYAFMEKAT